MHKELAKITSTMLGIEDHGIFTAMLYVEYEAGSGQGIGGYTLDQPHRDANDKFVGRVGTAYGMQFIMGMLKAVGVDAWEKLTGQMIYVLRESDSCGARVLGIQGLEFGGKHEPFVFDSFAAVA